MRSAMSSIRSACRVTSSPSVVSVARYEFRFSNLPPRVVSSSLIRNDNAGWVMLTRAAAARTLPKRATHSSASSWASVSFNGGAGLRLDGTRRGSLDPPGDRAPPAGYAGETPLGRRWSGTRSERCYRPRSVDAAKCREVSSVRIAAWVAVTRDEHDAASEAKLREVEADPDLSAVIRESAFKRIGADEAPGRAAFLEWRIDLYAWAFIRYSTGAWRSGISSSSESLMHLLYITGFLAIRRSVASVRYRSTKVG